MEGKILEFDDNQSFPDNKSFLYFAEKHENESFHFQKKKKQAKEFIATHYCYSSYS